MHPKDLKIESYNYDLADVRIAKFPLAERDASKLLVYNNGAITEDIYKNVASQIPPESLLIFNQTKVILARLLFKKTTGGIIEIFCLEPHQQYADIHLAMLQKGKVWWKCMIGGASKWKDGTILTQKFSEKNLSLTASIVEKETASFTIELAWDKEVLTFAEVLEIAGKVPLPPYLHREAEHNDKERYQTVYAKEEGSVAAPTAGLHFTDGAMQSFSDKNIFTDFITLHVSAGTFKPVKSATIAAHEMHAEWIEISLETIQNIIEHIDRGIIAVGTTSLRTVESLYWIGAKLLSGLLPDFEHIAVTQWEPYESGAATVSSAHALQALIDWMLQNHQNKLATRTQIMVTPGYDFKIVKGLITNFHQPKSTLLLLIAALIGNDWKEVYDYAMQNDFRFLSYGDGSLLWAKVNKSLPSSQDDTND